MNNIKFITFFMGGNFDYSPREPKIPNYASANKADSTVPHSFFTTNPYFNYSTGFACFTIAINTGLPKHTYGILIMWHTTEQLVAKNKCYRNTHSLRLRRTFRKVI